MTRINADYNNLKSTADFFLKVFNWFVILSDPRLSAFIRGFLIYGLEVTRLNSSNVRLCCSSFCPASASLPWAVNR